MKDRLEQPIEEGVVTDTGKASVRPSSLPPFKRTVFALFTFCSALLIGLFGGGLLPQKLADVLAYFAISKSEFGILAGVVTLISILLGCTALWAIPRFGIFRVCLAGKIKGRSFSGPRYTRFSSL